VLVLEATVALRCYRSCKGVELCIGLDIAPDDTCRSSVAFVCARLVSWSRYERQDTKNALGCTTLVFVFLCEASNRCDTMVNVRWRLALEPQFVYDPESCSLTWIRTGHPCKIIKSSLGMDISCFFLQNPRPKTRVYGTYLSCKRHVQVD